MSGVDSALLKGGRTEDAGLGGSSIGWQQAARGKFSAHDFPHGDAQRKQIRRRPWVKATRAAVPGSRLLIEFSGRGFAVWLR
jgi:hypothetical protein